MLPLEAARSARAPAWSAWTARSGLTGLPTAGSRRTARARKAARWRQPEWAGGRRRCRRSAGGSASTAATPRRARRRLTAGPTRNTAAATRYTGCRIHEQEGPFVVMVPPLVQPDRFVLALAEDSGNAARHHTAGAHGRGHGRTRGRAAYERSAGPDASTGRSGRRSGWGRGRRRRSRRPRPGLASGPPREVLSGNRSALTGNGPADGNRHEVVVRDRILVLLPQEVPLNQRVEAGRQRLIARLEQPDRAHVLLAAKHELFFLLTLGVVPPDRQRDRHQHGHHGQRNEQRGHCVAIRSAGAGTRCRQALTP